MDRGSLLCCLNAVNLMSLWVVSALWAVFSIATFEATITIIRIKVDDVARHKGRVSGEEVRSSA